MNPIYHNFCWLIKIFRITEKGNTMFKQVDRRGTSPFSTPHESCERPCIISAPVLWKLQYAEGNYIRKSTLNTSNNEVFIMKNYKNALQNCCQIDNVLLV